MQKQNPSSINKMGRLADNSNMALFSIRILDENSQNLLNCPSPPICSKNHNFLFLIKGEVMVEINNMRHLVLANECMTIPEKTTFKIIYFKNCFGYMGSFNTDFLCASPLITNSFKGFTFLQVQGNYVTRFDHTRSGFIQVILDRIFSETLSVPQNNDVIRVNLNSFLVEIAIEAEKSQTHPNSFINSLCQQFMELVFSTEQQKLSVSEYAENLNVSADHLNKVIKKNTGKSASAWIEDSLILSAKMMLKNTDLTMNEIAENLGILDSSYFARKFKTHEKISPTEYRKLVKRN